MILSTMQNSCNCFRSKQTFLMVTCSYEAMLYNFMYCYLVMYQCLYSYVAINIYYIIIITSEFQPEVQFLSLPKKILSP